MEQAIDHVERIQSSREAVNETAEAEVELSAGRASSDFKLLERKASILTHMTITATGTTKGMKIGPMFYMIHAGEIEYSFWSETASKHTG